MVTDVVVTSEVNVTKVRFDAKKLGEISGVPATGFDLYVREEKSVISCARLLELTHKLSPQTGPQTPSLSKRGYDIVSSVAILVYH